MFLGELRGVTQPRSFAAVYPTGAGCDPRSNVPGGHDPPGSRPLFVQIPDAKIIAKNAKNLIKPNGKIYLEIGAGQSNQIIKIFEFFGWHFERAEKDLSGINRVLTFTI